MAPVPMGVRKLENIAPRVGFEPTPLVIPRASVLAIILPRLRHAVTLSTPTCVCGALFEKSVQTTM